MKPKPSPVLPLPMTRSDLRARGWEELDILLVTGDAYVDHPSFGIAMVGRVLEADGWRVGVVAQPEWTGTAAFTVMGRPRLFCGVSAGNLDSMLANYTAARHRRQEDDFSAGGKTGRRPNHACVVYAQRVREAFPGLPVILGGIEASLRRLAHYDYWEDKLRPSILLSSKADLLVYGMGETTVREVARRVAAAEALDGIRGTARLLGAAASAPFLPGPGGSGNDHAGSAAGFALLPSWEELQHDAQLLLPQTRQVEAEQNPFHGRRLVQFHGGRAALVEPPALPSTPVELDRFYELPFTRQPHPLHRERIPAFEMIRDSVTVVRGCAGGCSFCGLGLHQGKFIVSRTSESVLRELRTLAESASFRGTVSDLGGPTANMYGCANGIADACRRCRRPSCLFPEICPHFAVREKPALELLRAAGKTTGVKHLFVSSGIRMDAALRQPEYLRELVRHHVSGHLKVAPEHLHPEVLRRMRKPGPETFLEFQRRFAQESRDAGKEQYLVPYFISSFPGCTEGHMRTVEEFLRRTHWNLQQVQDFIPLPMTPAAAMYVTGLDYETGQPIPVVRGAGARRRQQAAFKGAGDRARR